MKTPKPPKMANLTAAFRADIWAIEPGAFEVVTNIIMERMRGDRPDAAELQRRLAGAGYGAQAPEGTTAPAAYDGGAYRVAVAPAPAQPEGREVAVIPLHGVLINRAGFLDQISGATSPQQFAAQVRQAANDEAVTAIVIDLDTPGGTVSGTDTAAQAVAYAAARKPVYTVANEQALSAGYWIAAQGTRLIVPANGQLGSIGVIATHHDYTAQLAALGVKPTVLRSTPHKALGQPVESLTDESTALLQAQLDEWHTAFVQAVATGRGVTPATAAGWADGHVLFGAQAVSLGMADALGDLPAVVAALAAGQEYPAAEPATPTAAPRQAAQGAQGAQGAPQPTQAAQGATQGAQAPTPAQHPHPAQANAGTLQHQEAHMKTIEEIQAKLASGAALTAEEWTALAEHATAQATTAQAEAAAPAVNLDALPEPARAQLAAATEQAAAAQAEATAAKAEAATLRAAADLARYEAEAAQLGRPAAFAAVLREADQNMTPEAAAQLREGLRAGAAATEVLTRPVGHDGTGTGATADAQAGSYPTAAAELEARAAEQRAAEPGLSRFAAKERVFAADPDLRRRYSAEARRR